MELIYTEKYQFGVLPNKKRKYKMLETVGRGMWRWGVAWYLGYAAGGRQGAMMQLVTRHVVYDGTARKGRGRNSYPNTTR